MEGRVHIRKYNLQERNFLSGDGATGISVPVGSKVLSVCLQGESFFCWVLEPVLFNEREEISYFITTEDLQFTYKSSLIHRATLWSEAGSAYYHVFERRDRWFE